MQAFRTTYLRKSEPPRIPQLWQIHKESLKSHRQTVKFLSYSKISASPEKKNWKTRVTPGILISTPANKKPLSRAPQHHRRTVESAEGRGQATSLERELSTSEVTRRIFLHDSPSRVSAHSTRHFPSRGARLYKGATTYAYIAADARNCGGKMCIWVLLARGRRATRGSLIASDTPWWAAPAVYVMPEGRSSRRCSIRRRELERFECRWYFFKYVFRKNDAPRVMGFYWALLVSV